jgi:hypothetical protein
LYWPIHDLWQTSPRTADDALSPVACTVHRRDWLLKQPIHATASTLWNRGWGFDYVSDRQLAAAECREQAVVTPGGRYRAVLVPAAKLVPLPTMQKLLALAERGGNVIFVDALPQDVPGLADLEKRRAALKAALATLRFDAPAGAPLRRATLGKGCVLVGNVEAALERAGVARERIADHPGVCFVRRNRESGKHYFLANQGMRLLDAWVPLATPAQCAVVMDPLSGRTGVAELRRQTNGLPEVRLRLEPGHSLVLRTFEKQRIAGPAWVQPRPAKTVAEVAGPWRVEFLQGGPALPKPYETARPASWTANGDPESARFAGTAVYRATFDAPGDGTRLLDLGDVRHSARVRVNGRDLGTLLMRPYRVEVAGLKPKDNLLEIEVTNLSANRIRDLDRRKVPWRIFQDANVVNIGYRPFDASKWPVFDSGLLGPVILWNAEAP